MSKRDAGRPADPGREPPTLSESHPQTWPSMTGTGRWLSPRQKVYVGAERSCRTFAASGLPRFSALARPPDLACGATADRVATPPRRQPQESHRTDRRSRAGVRRHAPSPRACRQDGAQKPGFPVVRRPHPTGHFTNQTHAAPAPTANARIARKAQTGRDRDGRPTRGVQSSCSIFVLMPMIGDGRQDRASLPG